MNNVLITEAPLSADRVLAAVQSPDAGGVVLFLGTVRNATKERPVERLTYEAYHGMADSEFHALIAEARASWTLCRACIHHRTGELSIGEISVAVAVSAPHRAEAFAACRFLIDKLKERAPIWKKEHFTDGDAEWVQGS